MATTPSGGREMVTAEELGRVFGVELREDPLTRGLALTVQGKTIVVSPTTGLASIGGRVVTLSTPPVRGERGWSLPMDFVDRALSLVYQPRLDVRPATHLIVVGDVRVPRVAGPARDAAAAGAGPLRRDAGDAAHRGRRARPADRALRRDGARSRAGGGRRARSRAGAARAAQHAGRRHRSGPALRHLPRHRRRRRARRIGRRSRSSPPRRRRPGPDTAGHPRRAGHCPGSRRRASPAAPGARPRPAPALGPRSAVDPHRRHRSGPRRRRRRRRRPRPGRPRSRRHLREARHADRRAAC